MSVIGIDVGGTHTKAAVVAKDGICTCELSLPTPASQGVEAVVSVIIEHVRRLQKVGRTIEAVGIGAAGRIDSRTGVVLGATGNLPGWTGTRLKAIVEQECSLPTFVENDVNAAAIGEGWLGCGAGVRHWALLTIGTGLGGALVHESRIVNGPAGGAGEIGHMIVCPGGLPCNCGQTGCLEQYVSGTALNRMAKLVDPEWDSRLLMSRFAEGDERAARQIGIFTAHLAVGLVTLQNIYDPQLIVIGGGAAESFPLWRTELERRLRAATPREVPITAATLGNRAGIIGAARFAYERSGCCGG